MRLLAILLSSFILISCQVPPPAAPKGSLCVINASSGYTLCFDLEKDFDQDLKLKKDVQGVKSPVVFTDLHKNWTMDTPTKENLQAYALKWKARYLKLEKECK